MYNDDVLCVECNVNPPDVLNVLKDLKGFANGKFKQD